MLDGSGCGGSGVGSGIGSPAPASGWSICNIRLHHVPTATDSGWSLGSLAALAVDGGALATGVADGAWRVSPIQLDGARERIENIAHDAVDPSVEIVSYAISADEPWAGVLWVEIPQSLAMAHQVDGVYYKRLDAQNRPMTDSDVVDRIVLRQARPQMIRDAMAQALLWPEPVSDALYARTCVVARPVGAGARDLFERTATPDAWESFARDLSGITSGRRAIWVPTPSRFWGIVSHRVVSPDRDWSYEGSWGYRDIAFDESGAFSHLSYA